jgi:CheY-like chemotaxis protein
MAACRQILVIESSADAGAALCALLETWGHHAVFARTGRQGLRQALQGSLDVIVLDLGLDDMDGCRLVQLIRAEPIGAVPVIIAYSGSHHREAETREAGCDAFILKPSIEELESLIGLSRKEVRKYADTAGPSASRRR